LVLLNKLALMRHEANTAQQVSYTNTSQLVKTNWFFLISIFIFVSSSSLLFWNRNFLDFISNDCKVFKNNL